MRVFDRGGRGESDSRTANQSPVTGVSTNGDDSEFDALGVFDSIGFFRELRGLPHMTTTLHDEADAFAAWIPWTPEGLLSASPCVAADGGLDEEDEGFADEGFDDEEDDELEELDELDEEELDEDDLDDEDFDEDFDDDDEFDDDDDDLDDDDDDDEEEF